MTEYRFWLRERGRSRNKWHVSVEYLRPTKVGDLHVFDLGPYDICACGKGFGNVSSATHETQELPNGTLPTDASGTCRHCLRWLEVEQREEEAAERERRSRVFYVNGSETAVELPWKDGRKYEQT
jgi:hypothetical protein